MPAAAVLLLLIESVQSQVRSRADAVIGWETFNHYPHRLESTSGADGSKLLFYQSKERAKHLLAKSQFIRKLHRSAKCITLEVKLSPALLTYRIFPSELTQLKAVKVHKDK